MMYKLRIIDDIGFEVWQDIPGYEGLYQVSTYGRIKSRRKELSPNIGTDGYYHVDLFKEGKRRAFLIHRLVALIYIPNFDLKEEVNHIDENKINNNVENLEWLSSKENANYGSRNTRAIETKKEKGYMKNVSMLNLDGEFIRKFDSMADAARYVNGKKSNIWCCCNNKAVKAYGYKWAYA